MTDERLCAACGHVEYWHGEVSVPLPHPKSGPACARCMGQNDVDPWHDFSPPEAAPSTDEGEARWERRHSTGGRVWWRSPEGGYVLIDESLEAAIRAPLEERIRELERELELARMGAAALAGTLDRVTAEGVSARAEVERLREALRDTATHLNMASLVVDTALLPSPPSSTEGTKEGGE